MSEDYTHKPVPNLVALQKRIRDLEAQLNAAIMRWNDVPITSILALYDGLPAQDDAGLVAHLDAIGDWLCDVCPTDDEAHP